MKDISYSRCCVRLARSLAWAWGLCLLTPKIHSLRAFGRLHVLCFVCILQVVPQRYPAAVHAVALQHALAAYSASCATGPAVQELQQVLVATCVRVWEGGRQQCSQLSLTGEQMPRCNVLGCLQLTQ